MSVKLLPSGLDFSSSNPTPMEALVNGSLDDRGEVAEAVEELVDGVGLVSCETLHDA